MTAVAALEGPIARTLLRLAWPRSRRARAADVRRRFGNPFRELPRNQRHRGRGPRLSALYADDDDVQQRDRGGVTSAVA